MTAAEDWILLRTEDTPREPGTYRQPSPGVYQTRPTPLTDSPYFWGGEQWLPNPEHRTKWPDGLPWLEGT